jgi:hypothetical protein
MQMEDWLKLRSDYFEPVARDVFDQYLRQHGFGKGEADETGCLTYHRSEVVLRVYYWVEDSPNYSPMVSVGLDLKSPLAPAVEQIGVWYAVPANVEERNYETWTFSNADELKAVLGRIRVEVVDVYARPLWEDPDRLAVLIDRRNEEYKAERSSAIADRNKQDAERAFRAQDYEKAAKLYGSINHADLSLAERKRHEIAKRHIS